MSRLFPASEITSLGTKLFVAAGATETESRIATESLVTSSLMGHDSHGVLRIPEYLGFVANGRILPLGGGAGHKGFTLSLLVEILGSALAGFSSQDKDVFGNGVCFLVMDPSAFCPLNEFRRLMDDTIAYMKLSQPAPGVDEVLVPGDLEFRTLRQRERDGIPVDDSTRAPLRDHAERLQVDWSPLPRIGGVG